MTTLNTATLSNHQAAGFKWPGLLQPNGDRLSFDTSAHSGCMADVVIMDGKIGANAYCAVSAPGLPPARTGTKFIAAE